MNTIVGPKPQLHYRHASVARNPWVTGLAALAVVAMMILLAADRLYNPDKFRFEQVEVRAAFIHVDSEQVRAAVEATLNGNYFSASLEAIAQGLRKMPWVFSAAVRRQWPATLVVEVDEIQPIASWGDHKWLNATGDLVDRQPWDGALPQLSGPDTQQQQVWQSFQAWHQIFAAHGLSLQRLRLDERELWYLTLSITALQRNAISNQSIAGGLNHVVTMIVDNSDATARIKRLINALNSQLIAGFGDIKSIDLRYPNGFAINRIKHFSKDRKLTQVQ